MVRRPLVVQGLLITEASRSHSDTPHSVGLLWTNDQPDAKTFTWQHTTFVTDRYPCPGGIRTRNLSKRAAADPRLRVRLHRSQNRHNTANQHLSGYTLQERVATFKPTTVLSTATTLESYAHCSKYLARLSARNKLTLLAPDNRGR
jgi:hypothetical protein